MRVFLFVLALLLAFGLGVAGYLFKPVEGPRRDLTLVGDATRGAYLIRLGGCVTCHTNSSAGMPLMGGGAGIASPFGTFYPPNITPDPVAGIGNWTLAQFSDAMSNGMGPQGPLYPAFPGQHYTLMSDQEIADLYAALKAVPPYATASRPHDVGFPFNIRFGLLAWQNLFFKPARYQDDPAQSADWNRGRYLVFGPGHCVMCHSPRNMLGAIPAGKELTGNPAGGFGGKAPALTFANLKTMQYEPASLEQMLKDGTTSGFDTVTNAMADVVKDETSQWTDADRAAVATYLFGGQ